MNKERILYVVSFLAGALSAGVVVSLSAKKKYEALMAENQAAAEEFVQIQIEHSKKEVKEWADAYITEALVNGYMKESNSPYDEEEKKPLNITEKPPLESLTSKDFGIVWPANPEKIVEDWDRANPEEKEVYAESDHPHDDEPDEEDEEEEVEQPELPPFEKKKIKPIELITSDEFFDTENTHEKITLVYYEGDDTLADERDGIIPNANAVIGPDAVDNFGEGSDDPNVVYVRNNKSSCDFEVVRNTGSYSKEILGYDEADVKVKHRAAAAKPKSAPRSKKVTTDGEV